MRHKIFHSFGILILALALVIAGFTPAAAAPLPKVAIYSAPGYPNYNGDIIAKLTATGQFSQVDDLSPLGCSMDATPTLATLQEYAAVLVYSDCTFNDAEALGNVLADYIDGGGHVVIATFAFWTLSGGIGLGGRIVSGGYLPLTQGSQTENVRMVLIPDLPDDPLLKGVKSFDGGSSSFHNNGISLAPGATLVAHWTDNQPLAAFKGNVVALNFFPPSSDARPDLWEATTDGARLMANALNMGLTTTMEVSIDIKPGSLPNTIKPKSQGNTPVAVLSTSDFDAPAEVDRTSLTFGRSGDEQSLVLCNKGGEDVNGDGLLDLVCHFKTQTAAFGRGDTEGILKGQTLEGVFIEGSDSVKISLSGSSSTE